MPALWASHDRDELEQCIITCISCCRKLSMVFKDKMHAVKALMKISNI